MRMSDVSIHQYQWTFLQVPSEEDFCNICSKILNEPMLTECCGAHFCKACCGSSLSECSMCGKPSAVCITDKSKWRRILLLKVNCPMQEKGCLWTGSIISSHDHMTEDCEYMDLECSNACGERVERKNMADHLENFCSKRSTCCKHCGQVGEHENITGSHLLVCPDYTVVCPNGCGEKFKHLNLETHLTQCSNVVVPCVYRFAGCQALMERYLMTRHLQENTEEHTRLQTKLLYERLRNKLNTPQQLATADEGQSLTKTSEKFIQDSVSIIEQRVHKTMNEKIEQMRASSNQKIRKLGKHLNARIESLKCEYIKQFPTHGCIWEIDANGIQFEVKLASSQFNEVWKGVQYGEELVAVKKHKAGSRTVAQFLQEASILTQLKHMNIVSFLGASIVKEPHVIITEYMSYGNLLHVFKNEKMFTQPKRLHMIQQVTSGMEHLESLNCIHRLISSRSILLGSGMQCKIGSFTSARILNKGQEEYHMAHGECLPVKWSSPEILIHSKCSTKSDVWSFGFVQYEIITWKGIKMSNSTVEGLTKCGMTGGIKCPPECPQALFELISQCWNQNPDDRPSFSTIVSSLGTLKLT